MNVNVNINVDAYRHECDTVDMQVDVHIDVAVT